MNKLLLVLLVVILTFGVIMVWPFDKDYKIVETKEFVCKGLSKDRSDFIFSYPVFKDWPVKEAKADKANPGNCEIYFDLPALGDPTNPFHIQVNRFLEGTKSETGESVLRGPTKNAKTNPNGVLYDRFEEKDFGEWYEFYDDYRSVS
ncbi:hypothetical protein HZC08_00970, partial [Candidatus Micrarchaeota archaeon]|nr:hypothetical protein [Candidatus Micrarchaeota archaeon]